MIIYDSNQPSSALKLEGSNIPRAVLYTLPSVTMSVGAYFLMKVYPKETLFLKSLNLSQMWSASVIVLGVLLGMRTNQAYNRFWEGLTLVQRVRAEWFEATSNLVAFSLVAIKGEPSEKMRKDVNSFQYTLVRLMSLMHGAALRQIGGYQEEFQVLDVQALDSHCLTYLAECEGYGVNPVEVLLQWVQILSTDCMMTGVLAVPAPILTRCFQTLSRGMVNLHDARKLAECPFPFPLTQMVYVLLFLQCVLTPIFIAAVVEHAAVAGLMTFVPLFGMYAITFTAGELEHPFGNDPNDLPLSSLQKDMNKSLLMLLDKETYAAPALKKGSAQTVDSLRNKYTNSRASILTDSVTRSYSTTNPATWDRYTDECPPDQLENGDSVAEAEESDASVGGNLLPHREGSGEHPQIHQQGSPEAQNDVPIKKKPHGYSASIEQIDNLAVAEDLQTGALSSEPTCEEEIMHSLAEECVGALTHVLRKLLHHRVYASFYTHSTVIPSDLVLDGGTIDSAGEGSFHQYAANTKNVISVGGDMPPRTPPGVFGRHLLARIPTDPVPLPAPATIGSRLLRIGAVTPSRPPFEAHGPSSFLRIPSDPVPQPSPPAKGTKLQRVGQQHSQL